MISNVDLTVKINHITVATQDITYIHEQTNNLFINTKSFSTLTPADVAYGASPLEFATGTKVNAVGDFKAFIEAKTTDLVVGSYIFTKIPSGIGDLPRNALATADCTGAYEGCYTFADFNYLVMKVKTQINQNTATAMTVKSLKAYLGQPRTLQSFESYLWINNVFTEIVTHKFTVAKLDLLPNDLANGAVSLVSTNGATPSQ